MVILRDLSDVNDEGSIQNSRVGTPYQRQVRAHFTRADGSLNHQGYFSEILGFPLSSDLDSDSGDAVSNNSSGNSSDCVIISSSSFTGKRRDESLAFVAVGTEV
jgi:hypothetical protein